MRIKYAKPTLLATIIMLVIASTALCSINAGVPTREIVMPGGRVETVPAVVPDIQHWNLDFVSVPPNIAVAIFYNPESVYPPYDGWALYYYIVPEKPELVGVFGVVNGEFGNFHIKVNDIWEKIPSGDVFDELIMKYYNSTTKDLG